MSEQDLHLPWTVKQLPVTGDWVVYDSTGCCVGGPGTRRQADLQAAAPDLQAELSKTVETLIETRDCHAMMSAPAVRRALLQKRIDAINAAIPKAQGVRGE